MINTTTEMARHARLPDTPHRQRVKTDHRLDWAFETIRLARADKAGARPMVAKIEIEADLLGFTVRQSSPDRQIGLCLFLVSLEEAILEAGRLVHERLAEGYMASREVSD